MTEPMRTMELPPGRMVTIGGFAAAGFAMWIAPPVLGLIALVCAFVAWRKGDPLARWVVVAAVACALAGQIINWLPESFVSS